jgi:hypothetical protein
MLPQPLFTPVITTIFEKMSTICNCAVGAWQRRFLQELLRTVFAMRGRVNSCELGPVQSFLRTDVSPKLPEGFQLGQV